MREFGLKLKPEKCSFLKNSVKYLGHEVSTEGISPDMDRVAPIRDQKPPKTLRELRGFLGFCSFYRKFVLNFSKISQPLNNLLKKDAKYVWGPEQDKAFNELKRRLLSPPILCHFDPTQRLELRTDSSMYAMGCHLVQYSDPKHKRLLACASKTLNAAQSRYSTSERECLAICFALEKFRPYIFGRQIDIVCDHLGLQFLMTKKAPAGRLSKMAMKIMGYNFRIIYNKGVKLSDADFLSRIPTDKEELVSCGERNLNINALSCEDFASQNVTEAQQNDSLIKPVLEKHQNLTDRGIHNTFTKLYVMKCFTKESKFKE